MKLTVKKGTTSKLLRIFIQDSSSTTGAGLTGLVYNTASLTAYYIREGAASATAITLVTATVGTYASSGFKEVDATNMPGVYELHPPDAILASGADSALIFLKGATNMAPLPIEIQLDDNTTADVYSRVGAPAGASIAADVADIPTVAEFNARTLLAASYFDPAADTVAKVTLVATTITNTDMRGTELAALAATALTNTTWTDAKAALIDAAISGRAPANEYDTQMGYIPANLGDVPTATELIAAHGSGAWTTADVSALATSANVAAVPSDVWDEILTGATHNIPTSAGRRVREIGAFAIHSGTAQAGNSHSITLAATASPSDVAYNGIYNRNLVVLTDNTGVGQTRTIVDYDAITKICVMDRDWRISPDATTAYQITPDDTPLTVDHGVAQGGTANTITIRDYASDDDDAYLCNIIAILAGTGRGQARLVDAYDGTTKVVTICGDDWVTTPDTTSVYAMMPYGVACAACMGAEALEAISDTVLDELVADHTVAGSLGKAITDMSNESGGKWEITGNQMIFYELDNVTEVMRFNLFDSSGDPAMTNVYKRERVP